MPPVAPAGPPFPDAGRWRPPEGREPAEPPPFHLSGRWPSTTFGAPPAASPPAGFGQAPAAPPPGLPGPHGAIAPPPPPTGRGSPLRLILLALVVLLALVAGGVYLITHRSAPGSGPSAPPTRTPSASPAPTLSPTPVTSAAFTDPGHDFSALFPATPTSTTGSETEAGITLQYTIWLATDPSTGDQYAVIYLPYPASANISDPRLGLQAGVNDMVATEGETLVSQQSTTYDGYPAEDCVVTKDGLYVEYQFLIAGHVFYAVGVESGQNPPPGFTAFAGSLEILSTSGGSATPATSPSGSSA